MTDSYEIYDFIHTCWTDVFEKVQGAAVYIDHAASECLHWYTGDKAYLSLKNAGAESVHELAMYNFQYVRVHGTTKAVIVVTSADQSFYQRTLKLIIEKNSFDNCTIVCAVHFTIFKYTSLFADGDENSYEQLRQHVLSWMRMKNLSKDPEVEVMFRPLFAAPITRNVFVAPPFGRLMPPIDGELIEEHETSADYLVSSLHSLFAHFNVKEDIYSLGKHSEYIADKLENLQAAVDRRKLLIGQSGVTLILVDRTMDLCTVAKHDTESMLSRILGTLPHLPYHNNDVSINMTPLCPNGEESPLTMMISGCLANDDDTTLNLLIEKKQKDVLLTLNKWLMEMSLVEQSPKTRIPTRVTVHSLEKNVHTFRDIEKIESIARSNKKLQIILAVIQSLKSNKTAQIELLVSLEKLVLQNLAVSGVSSSILSQISNIVKMRNARGLDMENLLVLLIFIYSLAGTEIPFSSVQEESLRSSLIEAIFEDIQKCNDSVETNEVSIYQQTLLLLGANDEKMARDSAIKITEQIINVLHAIAKQRETLHDYRSMIVKPSPQEMAQCVGLIERLVKDILDPAKPEIQDLQRKTASLISAGFNLLLKGRTKHHPTDNPWIIIYVLGGITAEEAKIVEDVASSRSNIPRITLAGCRLLCPLDVSDKVLLSTINI
ncbi:sec1 family domain-containing protein 2-like [Venturia canescens]|uniref:sec1 family domain-containing protein 2-like n=1 Tax=Venturia canescens TaxID=32260 RepID=UPI001C9D3E40|nr:sec1 family domain-containing protein 2-like [Venturia canescens]